jgi:hypothetical protein
MKERLLYLYELYKIDKEMEELNSQKGDLPDLIEVQTGRKAELEEQLAALKEELGTKEEKEKQLTAENEKYLEKIEKDDELLRSGGVKSNKEYNALAKEIEEGMKKINANETEIKEEITPKKKTLSEHISALQKELDELIADLKENQEQLEILSEENREEESHLNSRREELLPKIPAEDMEFYHRINIAKPGNALAVVRKGSCLGCFNSIPPQRVIEIRMAEKFFTCESCGRILISEEFINS